MQSDDRPNDDQKNGAADAAEEERVIRIMQYCDGVLPAREAARVAEEIARDPEAARLAAEMSAGAEAARLAWGSIGSGPVPFDLAQQVKRSARGPVSQTRSVAADWRMAAALVVGAALGMLGLLVAQHGPESGLRLAGIDKAPNGTEVSDTSWQPGLISVLAKDPETARVTFSGPSGSDTTVSVARWFDTAAGLRCAEFATSTAEKVTAGGVACRKADGGWDVIAQPR